MSKAPLLALFLTLSAVLPAEGRLGRPSRVVPPRYGPVVHNNLFAESYDGKNFLFTARTLTSFQTSTKSVFLVGPDGTQLSDPVLVPVDAQAIGMTDGMYIVTAGNSFVRLSARGEWIDAAPLPVRVKAGAAGPRRFFVFGEGKSFLVDSRGNATPAGSVPGSSGWVSVKERVFAVNLSVEGQCHLRMLDDEGHILRDGPTPAGACGLGTDGTTWLLHPTSRALPYRIVDDNLNVLVTFDEDTFLYPIRGWGYLGIDDRLDRFPHADFPARVFELRASAYTAQKTTLLNHVFGASQIRGNGQTRLYLEQGPALSRAYLLSSVAQLDSPLPPPLSFTGGLDREAPVALANSAGVSLLVWNEPEPDPSRSAMYAARVSATGALLDAHPMLLSRECRDVRSTIATDGSGFLVGWAGCGRAGAHLVTAEGIAAQSFAATRNRSEIANLPAVAFDGESYVMVWPDGYFLSFARVLPDGSPVRPAIVRMRGQSPQVAARPGGGWLLVYSDDYLHRLMSQPLTSDVNLTNETESILREYATAGSLVRRDDGYLLLARHRGAAGEPFLIRVDDRGKASSRTADVPIGTITPRMFCESECTLVWREDDSGNLGRIVAAPVREPAPPELALGEPVTVGTHDTIFRIGDPVLFRGSVDDPRLLLYSAPEGESGAVQIFARTAESKRRASRP